MSESNKGGKSIIGFPVFPYYHFLCILHSLCSFFMSWWSKDDLWLEIETLALKVYFFFKNVLKYRYFFQPFLDIFPFERAVINICDLIKQLVIEKNCQTAESNQNLTALKLFVNIIKCISRCTHFKLVIQYIRNLAIAHLSKSFTCKIFKFCTNTFTFII